MDTVQMTVEGGSAVAIATGKATTSKTYDLRGWLERVEELGVLRTVEGASVEGEIGEVTDLLQHSERAPAVLFDKIPGYSPGFRVLVNALGSVDRMAIALGAPMGLTKLQLS
jgi:4-hydroxy-3-polyprenylbenzoate decarboxylase